MPVFGVHVDNLRTGQTMPAKYTRDRIGGLNASPPLHVEAVPPGTQSVAIAMIDRDASDYVHWMVVGLPPRDQHLSEGASRHGMPDGSHELFNDAHFEGYAGPKPPPRTGAHRYVLEAYALDTPDLELPDHATYQEFRRAAEPHAVDVAQDYWLDEDNG